MIVLVPESVLDGLESVTISYQNKSETRGVNAVEVSSADSGKSYFICDTAGVNDTAGPEFEIANSVAMINAVAFCESVKVVFVLSPGQVGDNERFTTLRSTFLNSIKRLLVDVPSLVSSCYYLFNKYSMDGFGSMCDRLSELSEKDMSADERADKDFISLIRDMQAMAIDQEFAVAKGERPRFRCINLMDGSSNELLKDFDAMQAIADPSKSFRGLVGDAVVSKLKDQCGHHVRAICKAIDRRDFSLVRFKMDQLKWMVTYLSNVYDCKSKYKEALDSVLHRMTNVHGSVFKGISRCLEDVQDNSNYLSSFCESVRELFELETIRVGHFTVECSNGELDCDDLRAKACSQILLVLERTMQLVRELFPLHLSDRGYIPSSTLVASASNRLRNWCTFAGLLPQLHDQLPAPDDSSRVNITELITFSEDMMATTMNQMSDYLSSLKKDLDDSFNTLGGQRYSLLLQVLQKLESIRPFSATLPVIETTFVEALHRYESSFADDCAQALILISKTVVPDEKVWCQQAIETANIVFEGLRASIAVLPADSVERFQNHVRPILEKVNDICVLAALAMKEVTSSDIPFAAIRHQVRIIDDMRMFEEVEQFTNHLYSALMEAIRRTVTRVKENALTLIVASSATSDDLSHALVALRQASCFRDHPKRVYEGDLENVIASMAGRSDQDTKLLTIPLDFNQHSALKQAYNSYVAINCLQNATGTLFDSQEIDSVGAQLRELQAGWSIALAQFNATVVEASDSAIKYTNEFVEVKTDPLQWPTSWLSSLRDVNALDKLRSALQFFSLARGFKHIEFPRENTDKVHKVLGLMQNTVQIMYSRLRKLLVSARKRLETGDTTFNEESADEMTARLDYLRVLATVARGEEANAVEGEGSPLSVFLRLRTQASTILHGDTEATDDRGVYNDLYALLIDADKYTNETSSSDLKLESFALCQLLISGIL